MGEIAFNRVDLSVKPYGKNYKYDDISIICLNEQSIKEIQNSLQKEHISYVKKK